MGLRHLINICGIKLNFSNYSVIFKACGHWEEEAHFGVFHFRASTHPFLKSGDIGERGVYELFGVHHREYFERLQSCFIS